eukprot:SM000275S10308  [mRNA]  locus=s275:52141:53853:+ [translate_table: standard]
MAISSIVAGGWVFTACLAMMGILGTREYFGLAHAKALARGWTPAPPIATMACTLMCTALPVMTYYFGGHIIYGVVTATCLVAAVLLIQPTRPRKGQFTSALFGLFYCGYLPTFWIKLRCSLPNFGPLPAPAFLSSWPLPQAATSEWTVGLVATFVAFSTIIAADTGAYLGGKTFGRTPLIDISPKKTREGALAGLLGAVGVAVGLSKLFLWPSSIFSSATLGVLVFMASLFGDLTESMLKRDAGVKDSGQLIPGHGGILDRVDSYIFTGALVYSFVKVGLPLFG